MLAARYARLDIIECYAAHVAYVDRIYASSTVPRMNGQPLCLAAAEPG